MHTHDLVVSLREFVHKMLGLDAIPVDLALPKQGPTRPGAGGGDRGKGHGGTDDDKGGGNGGRGGGGMGGGMGAGMGAGVGVGVGGHFSSEDYHQHT